MVNRNIIIISAVVVVGGISAGYLVWSESQSLFSATGMERALRDLQVECEKIETMDDLEVFEDRVERFNNQYYQEGLAALKEGELEIPTFEEAMELEELGVKLYGCVLEKQDKVTSLSAPLGINSQEELLAFMESLLTQCQNTQNLEDLKNRINENSSLLMEAISNYPLTDEQTNEAQRISAQLEACLNEN